MTELDRTCVVCERPARSDLCARCRGAELFGAIVINGDGDGGSPSDTVFAGRYLPPVPPVRPRP